MSDIVLKYASLFGGSGDNKKSKEYLETIKIGELLASNGFTIKNGGYGGMMEAVSFGATQVGGQSIGITCKEVGSPEGNQYLSETIVTDRLYDRLYDRLPLLIEETSLFIVQKGGIGTLSEVFLTLDILRKETIPTKPKVLFIGDFWNKILEPIKENVLPESEHNLFVVLSKIEQIKEYL